jgi:hypothetical protein
MRTAGELYLVVAERTDNCALRPSMGVCRSRLARSGCTQGALPAYPEPRPPPIPPPVQPTHPFTIPIALATLARSRSGFVQQALSGMPVLALAQFSCGGET